MIETVAAPTSPVAPRVERIVWSALLAAVTLVPIVYALLSPRGYSSAALPVIGTLAPSTMRSLRTVLTLAEVAVASAVFFLALPVARTPRHGIVAALSGVALGGALVFSGWLHGARLTVGLAALPFTLLGMLAFPLPDGAWFEARLTRCLRVVVWGSLAAAVLAPAWAAQQAYTTGLLPLHTRLAGLTPHPNALGPIAAVLVILEVRRRVTWVPVLVALSALVWTQSKTAWAALAIVAVLAVHRAMRQRAPQRRLLPMLVLGLVVGASIFLALGLLQPGHRAVKQDTSAETFTGRTSIWEVTLEVWQAHPLTGIGPDLWNDSMDRRYRDRVGFAPGHAHSQLFQTLGESGLLGAAALVAFLVALGALAQRAERAAGTVAVSLFIVLVIDCFSEVPLQSIPVGTNFLLTMAVFSYALVGANDDR